MKTQTGAGKRAVWVSCCVSLNVLISLSLTVWLGQVWKQQMLSCLCDIKEATHLSLWVFSEWSLSLCYVMYSKCEAAEWSHPCSSPTPTTVSTRVRDRSGRCQGRVQLPSCSSYFQTVYRTKRSSRKTDNIWNVSILFTKLAKDNAIFHVQPKNSIINIRICCNPRATMQEKTKSKQVLMSYFS